MTCIALAKRCFEAADIVRQKIYIESLLLTIIVSSLLPSLLLRLMERIYTINAKLF